MKAMCVPYFNELNVEENVFAVEISENQLSPFSQINR